MHMEEADTDKHTHILSFQNNRTCLLFPDLIEKVTKGEIIGMLNRKIRTEFPFIQVKVLKELQLFLLFVNHRHQVLRVPSLQGKLFMGHLPLLPPFHLLQLLCLL